MHSPSTGRRGAENHTAVPGSVGQGHEMVRQREAANSGTRTLHFAALYKGAEVTPLPDHMSCEWQTRYSKGFFGLRAEGAAC